MMMVSTQLLRIVVERVLLLFMSSMRDAIVMTDAEVQAFLASTNKLQLGTVNHDGAPHLVTMFFALFDGKVGFWSYATSQKSKNLLRDPRVALLIESGDTYDQLCGVMIRGEAKVMTEFDDVRPIGEVVYGQQLGNIDDPGVQAFIDAQAHKRHAYLITPTSVASWDHRKLG